MQDDQDLVDEALRWGCGRGGEGELHRRGSEVPKNKLSPILGLMTVTATTLIPIYDGSRIAEL